MIKCIAEFMLLTAIMLADSVFHETSSEDDDL